jgi:hypothetical protein
MTIQDKLIKTVLRAKSYIACQSSALIKQSQYGSDIQCCQKKLFLLVIWVRIAECYNCDMFDDNGNLTDGTNCLTFEQLEQLLAKMEAMIR